MGNNKDAVSVGLKRISPEELGDSHAATSIETPLTERAFALSDSEKIETISDHFRAIMETLGLDMEDESLRGTPDRVAKMYVKEIFSGLDPEDRKSTRLNSSHV